MLYGPEKVGKTSLAAYAPKPVFIQIAGETGLEILIDSGQLPPTPHFPEEISSWKQLLGAIKWIQTSEHDHKTLVIDALEGMNSLCFDYVRDTRFGGDELKFMAFYKGYDISPNTWREVLGALDELRATRKMTIMLIGHSEIGKMKNPGGEDWTTYKVGIHQNLWSVTARWADAIFFMNFETIIDDGKATGGKTRMIYTENDASYVAGNRYGLTEDIDAGESGQEAFTNLFNALQAARGRKATP